MGDRVLLVAVEGDLLVETMELGPETAVVGAVDVGAREVWIASGRGAL